MSKKSKRNISRRYKRKKTKRNHINRTKRKKIKRKTQIGGVEDQIVPGEPVLPSATAINAAMMLHVRRVEEAMDARLTALDASIRGDIDATIKEEMDARLTALDASIRGDIDATIKAAIKQDEEKMDARLTALRAGIGGNILANTRGITRLSDLYYPLKTDQDMIKRILDKDLSVNWNNPDLSRAYPAIRSEVRSASASVGPTAP